MPNSIQWNFENSFLSFLSHPGRAVRYSASLRLGCLLIATWQTWRAQTEFSRLGRQGQRLTSLSPLIPLFWFASPSVQLATNTHTLRLPPPPSTFLWHLYLSRCEPKVTLSLSSCLSFTPFFFQFGSVNPYKHCDLFWELLGPLLSGAWQTRSSQT